jgi:hypothetical protein
MGMAVCSVPCPGTFLCADAALKHGTGDPVLLHGTSGVGAHHGRCRDRVVGVGRRIDPEQGIGAFGRARDSLGVALVSLDCVDQFSGRIVEPWSRNNNVGRAPACSNNPTTREPTWPVGVVTTILTSEFPSGLTWTGL